MGGAAERRGREHDDQRRANSPVRRLFVFAPARVGIGVGAVVVGGGGDGGSVAVVSGATRHPRPPEKLRVFGQLPSEPPPQQ